MQRQGTKSLFFPSSLEPHSSQNHTLGSPAPGPATPSGLRAGSPPRQSRIQTWEDCGEAGTRVPPWRRTLTQTARLLPLIYSLRLTRFTELTLHPFLTLHLPPTFQAPTFDPS